MESKILQRKSQIGLDRIVRLDWLEKAAALATEGGDVRAAKQKLKEDIKDFFRSKNPDLRGSIDKTVTILARTWLTPPPDLKDFRDAGLVFLKTYRGKDSLPVHWGMILAVYPFWGTVADQMGRLLKLQDSVSSSQVQRRLKETLGERETVSRRARYLIRSFLDWGVIRASNTQGIYQASQTQSVNEPMLTSWLVEAFLWSRSNGAVPLKELLSHPGFFPFKFPHSSIDGVLMNNPRIEVSRQNLNEIYVGLSRVVSSKIQR